MLFSLLPERPLEGGRCLTPACGLRLKLRPGSRLADCEKSEIAEISSALLRILESLRRRGGAGAPDAALAENHEGREGLESVLRVTFACNQRCPFCFVPLTGRGADFSDIEKKLEVLARLGDIRGTLTISGGEPTLDPRLFRILEAAHEKGFRRFGLQTNGVLLSKPGFIARLSGLGVLSYMVSFHSHKVSAYDRITGSRGQFPRAVEGLTCLLRACARDRNIGVTVNVVVNARNYRDLPGLVDFFGDMSAALPARRRPMCYFSMLNETGHQKAPSWAVDLSRAAPFVNLAVERCRERGLSVSPFGGESGFPPCLLSDPSAHAMKRELPQDRVRYAEDFSGEAGGVGRAKRPACRGCRYNTRCLGVPASYARLFGLGALRVPSR